MMKSNETIRETLSIDEYAIAVRLANSIKHHTEMNLSLHYGNTEELLDEGMIHMAIVEGNYPKRTIVIKNTAQRTLLPSVLHHRSFKIHLIVYMTFLMKDYLY